VARKWCWLVAASNKMQGQQQQLMRATEPGKRKRKKWGVPLVLLSSE